MITVAELRPIDLFDDLTDEQLELWAQVAELHVFQAGDVVVEQGEDPKGLILLLSGVVQLEAVDGDRAEVTSRNDTPTWIGGIAALTEGPLPLRIQAESDVRIATVPTEQFIDLALSQRAVHRRIMRQMAPVMARINAREANRDRLTSLGTMAAGLAHELNNPAAAARRAAGDLVNALNVISNALTAFVESGIEREDAGRLIALQREALERADQQDALEALDAADAEEAMLEALEDRDVPEPWNLAEPLAAAGLDADWLNRVAEIAGKATPKALKWVAASLTARGLASELCESTDRMSSLVKAVKTYAYMDRGELVKVDVHEGLESTLVVLGHKLKHSQISVKRAYDRDLPAVTVHGSELNQVWTNLLDNAIDAVDGHGTITVGTHRDGDCFVVDVGDDGPGIPEDAKKRILDPFFTTKPVGRGTGLGLDTVRRIVEERHRGSLWFDSGPGGTTFHVRMPLEATAR